MSNKKKIYTVATAHLDTVWSWDFETTVSKYIYNTLVDNFKLFKKYPTYTFSFEGSYRYELMEEYYPELFDKMKEYIKEGRWNVCGSSFENGDVNIPSPEALFRNILFGNSYFDKKFGNREKGCFQPMKKTTANINVNPNDITSAEDINELIIGNSRKSRF